MLRIYKIDRSIKGKISNFIKKDKSLVVMPSTKFISNGQWGLFGVLNEFASDLLKKNVYVLSKQEDIDKFKESYESDLVEGVYYIRHPKTLKTNILIPARKFQMYILEEQIEEMIDYLKARSSLKYLKVKISKSKGGSFGIDTIIEGLNLKGKVEAKKMSDFEFEITCNNKTEKTSQEIKTCWINEMKIFKSIVDNHSDTTFSIKQKIDNSFGMSVDIEKFLGLSGNVFDIYTYDMECTLY